MNYLLVYIDVTKMYLDSPSTPPVWAKHPLLWFFVGLTDWKGAFMALSPPLSKWCTAMGTLTDFEIQSIESPKSLEPASEQHELTTELQLRLTR